MKELAKRIYCALAAAYTGLFWSEDRKAKLLSTWQTPAARSPLEKILFKPVFINWVHNTYLREVDPDRREVLKDICMEGDGGIAWAEEYESRPIDLSARYLGLNFGETHPWYQAMDRQLQETPNAVVLQIGCSSGREIAYFAPRFPGASFVGTDIDARIVQRAAERHPLENAAFRIARAHELDDQIDPGKPLIVFSSGSMQYVQPEHLSLMLERLKKRGNTTIILGEPWREDGASFGQHTRWRGNFSYSHDYEAYAKAADFKTDQIAIISITKDPGSPHFITRHYFYAGSIA